MEYKIDSQEKIDTVMLKLVGPGMELSHYGCQA